MKCLLFFLCYFLESLFLLQAVWIPFNSVSVALHTFMKNLLQCIKIIVDRSLSPTYIQLKQWS